MKYILLLTLFCLGVGNINGQEAKCKVTVKLVEGGANLSGFTKTEEQLSIYYTAAFLADSISIIYAPETRKVLSSDPTVLSLNNQPYTIFTRWMAAYSPEVWIPGAYIYQNDSLKCTLEPQLILVDTLRSISIERDTDNGTDHKPKVTAFKWLDNEQPKLSISLNNKTTLGDTLHVSITTNFPTEALLPWLKSNSLKLVERLNSSYNLTMINGVTTRTYTQLYVFKVVGKNSIAFKKGSFVYEGQKVKIPKTRMSI